MKEAPTHRRLTWQQLCLTVVAALVSDQVAIARNDLSVAEVLGLNLAEVIVGFAAARYTHNMVGLSSDLREPIASDLSIAMAKVVLILPALLTVWALVAEVVNAPFRSYGRIAVVMPCQIGAIIERLAAARHTE